MPKNMGGKKNKKEPRPEPKRVVDDDEYEVEELDVDPLMAMMPMSFGKQDKKQDLAASFAKTKRTAGGAEKTAETKGRATEAAAAGDDDSDSDSDDMIGPMPAEALDPEHEEADDDDDLPLSHEIVLKDHTKAVSALTLDPSGSRLVSGSYDYDVKFWDFAGMGAALKPFKTIEPVEGHPVHHLEYSLSGDSLLVLTSSIQPRLFSREGVQLSEFVRGDVYLRDMRHTKGHVAEVTSGSWHPSNRDEFITASSDSTIRIWDVNNRWEHKTVLVVRGKGTGQQLRTKVTTCAYSPNGKWIGGACTDGTVHIWGTNGPFTRPTATVDGHARQSETSGMVFSQDGNHLITRGGDETVKLWDTRNFKQPIARIADIDNNHIETNIIYSPDQKYLLTGVSCPPDQEGHLLVLSASSLSPVRRIPISNSGVIRVLWNSRINQIITGSHNGSIHVLYSPNSSLRGAKLIVSRTPKARHVDDDTAFTTDVPEGYSGDQAARLEDGSGERLIRKLKAQAKAAQKAMAPEMPSSAVQSDPDKDHVKAHIGLAAMRDEDPREALLKFAEKAKNDPIFTKAYLKNQPKTLLEDRAGDDELEPPAKRRK